MTFDSLTDEQLRHMRAHLAQKRVDLVRDCRAVEGKLAQIEMLLEAREMDKAAALRKA